MGEVNRHASWVAALALVLVFCCKQHLNRTRWQQMSPEDKRLYVSSLLGGEKAKDAKGGGGRTYSGSAAGCVQRIDQAYPAGDTRNPAQIFATLADKR